MHEKQVFTETNYLPHPAKYAVFHLLCFRCSELRRHKSLNIFVLIFSRLERPIFGIFLSNQHRCGHRVVKAAVVRGGAGSIEEFVLICPLGKSSGEISWILLQMFHCVCMLGIGVGPFDLNENAPQRFAARASQSSAQRANQKPFPPLDFPRFPCRVYLLWSETWEYHGPSPWSISLLAQLAFGISSGNTLSQCQQWQTTNACMLPPTEFIFISTLLYHQSVSPHTGSPFQCKTVKQSTKQKIYYRKKWCITMMLLAMIKNKI